VPFQITPSEMINNAKTIHEFAGVAITTPSSGNSFNFDSLMDGGTGLTPTVAGPLLPNSAYQNRNPLDLMTPTSEPSKFVSL
jgi:fos-like antigen, invertebrate